MLFSPEKYNRVIPDINEELLKIQGEMDDKEAQITLAKFLRYNLGLAVDWIAGFKMPAYQQVALKAFFLRNFNLCVWGRGCAKSTIAAVAGVFIPIFEPGTNVILAGPSFRASKNIFSYMEKMENSKEAVLLKQCFGKKFLRNDQYEWKIGTDGLIRALPCSQDKIRGPRANLLIVDEFLQMSEDMVKNVLMPFLVAPSDIKERIQISQREDELIRNGELEEKNRTVFPNTSRMICLSSASYSFEFLYKMFKEWEANIYSPEIGKATYFVSQISYEALPSYMIEKTVIEEASRGTETHPSFKREYCAQFVDGSESFYSAKRMFEQTIKDGDKPTTLLRGSPGKCQILGIDPSWSASPSSDFFAMCVVELNEDNDNFTVVHNYGVAGGELKDHIKYFYYLLKAFNIVLIVPDNADGNFIQSANESNLFTKNNLNIKYIDYDGDIEGEDYAKMLKEVRKQYNKTDNRICFKQVFSSDSSRRMNEQLKMTLDSKRIWFASKLTAHDEAYQDAINTDIPYEFEGKDTVAEFISTQDDWIYGLKKQLSLIEIKVNPLGKIVWDLPQQLKRNTTASRARKDNFTSLLLATEGVNAYTNIMRTPEKETCKMFTPYMVGNSSFY